MGSVDPCFLVNRLILLDYPPFLTSLFFFLFRTKNPWDSPFVYKFIYLLSCFSLVLCGISLIMSDNLDNQLDLRSDGFNS